MTPRCTVCAKPEPSHVMPDGRLLCDDCVLLDEATPVDPAAAPFGGAVLPGAAHGGREEPVATLRIGRIVAGIALVAVLVVLVAGTGLVANPTAQGLAVLVGVAALVVGNATRLSRRR